MASPVRPAPALAKTLQDGASVLFGRVSPRGIHQPAFVGGVITLGVPEVADGKHLSLPQLVHPPNINAGFLPHSWINSNLPLLHNFRAPTVWQVASWEV